MVLFVVILWTLGKFKFGTWLNQFFKKNQQKVNTLYVMNIFEPK